MKPRLLAVVLLAGVLAASCGASGSEAKGGSKSSSSTAGSTSTTPAVPDPGFAYQPMFPFASVAEAAAWSRDHSGTDPGAVDGWHLDAAATTLEFAKFLGYGGLDRTGATTGDARDAHVALGAENPDGRFSTAAVVHLVRISGRDPAPWEVVGTDDTDFSLTAPPYGADVTSPVPVGGSITGVDESISVTVRAVHATQALGAACCVASGGNGTPWSTTVSFLPSAGGVVVIAASTGGHTASVERFTATAVKAPSRR